MSEYCGREDCLYILPHQHTQFGVIGATQVSIMYTLNCQRCGGVHHSPDGFALLCPRCRQLADLEREIGRAVIDAGVIFNAINPAIDELIARWRELHAEGAEGGKG